MVELINDAKCESCGAELRGRSLGAPLDTPGKVWMSLGRWVTVLAQTTTGRLANLKVVSHDRVLCWSCSPKVQAGEGMSPDSWRMSAPTHVVVAPKPKKRKVRRSPSTDRPSRAKVKA